MGLCTCIKARHIESYPLINSPHEMKIFIHETTQSFQMNLRLDTEKLKVLDYSGAYFIKKGKKMNVLAMECTASIFIKQR